MIYSEENNYSIAKCIGKYYRQSLHEKERSGNYHLSEISKGEINKEWDDNKLVKNFENAIESLKEYPSKHASTYYRLIKKRCIEGKTVEEIEAGLLLSQSLIYRRLKEAYMIIGENMQKEEKRDD